MAWFERIRPPVDFPISVVARFLRAALDFRQWQTLDAERHLRAGRVEEAEAALRRVLARQPKQQTALAALGRLLLRERRFGEAVEIWQRLVDLQPRRPGPSFQLARALHRGGRFEAAASQYLRVVALDPLHEKAFAALDQLTDRLLRPGGDGATAIDKASMIAQQLLVAGAGSSKLRSKALGLLAALRAKTDPDAAVGYWQQLAELNPGAIGPRLQLARHYDRRQQREEAQRHYRAVLELDPNHGEALLGYGQTLDPLDPVAAIRHFAAWSKRNPRDTAPRLELARLYQNSNALDHAEATYRD